VSSPLTFPTARGALPRLGISLLLALLTTLACRLLLGSLRGPGMWASFFYVRWLLPPALLVFWCTVLIPRETRALYRAARAHPSIASLLALLMLLASAAVLTSCTDAAFEWGRASARLKRDVVLPSAWATNVLILFCAYALVFAATSRVAAAQLLVAPAYVLLHLATLVKIKYMHVALQPLDLLRLPEFMPLFGRFFGTRMIVAAVLALGLWVAGLLAVRRTEPTRMSAVRRVAVGAAALAVLLAFPLGFYLAPSHPPVDALLKRLGAPERQHRDKVRTNGLLLSFLSELPVAFVVAPPGYSPEAVARALTAHPRPGATAPRKPQGHVNLILYVVESFMDPDDLGLHFTSDPIPNVHALRKAQVGGYGIVPELFGGSANTEFEALTGMTMSFLPVGSLPFRQYIRHPLPSLPRALGDLGFATTAVQADAKYYYNREQVYDLLGFEHVVWLNDVPGVERAARPGWPSDRAVVAAVIEASRGPHPFFVFAFPSSTHSPYTSGVYRDSDLDVLDPPPSDRVGELKEYINTIRVADQAIGTLIEHFRRQPDSTIIAIIGDHVAPLSADALGPFFAQLAGLPEVERARRMRRVPLLMWANFRLPREDSELSINALPSYLLARMGIPASGFLAVSDDVRRRIPVVGSYLQGPEGDIWGWDSLPARERTLLEDYWLLQYDLLLGKQYALRPRTAQ
jgi:sulfatase-like protein